MIFSFLYLYLRLSKFLKLFVMTVIQPTFQSQVKPLFLSIIVILITMIPSKTFSQTLVFSEFFNNSLMPDTWQEYHSENVTTNVWTISNSAFAAGMEFELHATNDPGTGITRIILPELDIEGATEINVHFKHFFEDLGGGSICKIQSSTDGQTWIDEAWNIASGNGNIGSESIIAGIQNITGTSLFLSFVIEGDLSSFSSWYIDDIEVFATIIYPTCPNIIFPLNEATNIPTNFNLQWEITPDASGYFLFAGSDNPPTNLYTGIDVGLATSFPLTGLQTSTQYYWNVVPYSDNGLSPTCLVNSFTTSETVNLPYSEMINSLEFPTGWFQESYQAATLWGVLESNYAGGDINELVCTFAEGNGESRLISPPFNTTGLNQVMLSFKHSFADYSPGLICKVQTSDDMISWHDAGWEFVSGTGNIGPAYVSINLTEAVGSITYISFLLSGDHYTFYYWAIDNIEVGNSVPVLPCAAATSPSNGSIVASQSVLLQWVDVPLADGYQLFAGTDHPPTNLVNGQALGDTTNYEITGLQAPQTYYWKVIPTNQNGSALDCPIWTFTTMGTISSFPWTENFDLNFDIPAGWTTDGEESWVIRSFSVWGPYHDHTSGTGKYALIDDSLPNQTISSGLITPEFDITTLNHPKCIFWYQVGTLNSYWSESDLLIDIWYNGDWVLDVNPTLQRHGVWKQIILDMTPFISSACKIRFRGVEDPVYLDSDIAIDDVTIKDTLVIIPCPDFNYPFVTDTMVSKPVLFGWDKSSNTNGYLFYLGTDNPPTNLVNGQNTGYETTFDFTVPDYNTTYYWSVFGYNSDDTLACPAWSFKTRPDPYRTLPFFENCNVYLTDLVPLDWNYSSPGNDMYWVVENTNNAGGDSLEIGTVHIGPTYMGPYLLYSPPLNVLGISDLTLSFRHSFISSGNTDGTLKVKTYTSEGGWQDLNWTKNMALGDIGPELVQLQINGLASDTLYVVFAIEGTQINFTKWYLDDISIEVAPTGNGSMTGTLLYGETGNAPLAFCTVKLFSDTTVIATTTSYANGSFSFPDIPAGTYNLKVFSTTSWGGGNSVDALLIMKHFVGQVPLTGLKLRAADINNSGTPNSVDALGVMNRFVGTQSSFPGGDWVFDQSSIIIPPATNVSTTLHGLCYGDINATYVPPISMGVPCQGMATINYGGVTYETVKIGTQCWIKQNMNIGTMIDGSINQANNSIIEKHCYMNDTNNCNVNGGLYSWAEAMQYSQTEGAQGICMPGFHIATEGEYLTLINFLGGMQVAAAKLKEAGTAHWNFSNHASTNISGFTAIPSGTRILSSPYFIDNLDNLCKFWTSTSYSAAMAYMIVMQSGSMPIYNPFTDKYGGVAIRCIKD